MQQHPCGATVSIIINNVQAAEQITFRRVFHIPPFQLEKLAFGYWFSRLAEDKEG
jgi:hypothetical protein